MLVYVLVQVDMHGKPPFFCFTYDLPLTYLIFCSIVLMDELDQLVTSKQEVVYNFFNWPTLLGSKLVVIAVANTMDLPERVMTGRVRSRLGLSALHFLSHYSILTTFHRRHDTH